MTVKKELAKYIAKTVGAIAVREGKALCGLRWSGGPFGKRWDLSPALQDKKDWTNREEYIPGMGNTLSKGTKWAHACCIQETEKRPSQFWGRSGDQTQSVPALMGHTRDRRMGRDKKQANNQMAIWGSNRCYEDNKQSDMAIGVGGAIKLVKWRKASEEVSLLPQPKWR